MSEELPLEHDEGSRAEGQRSPVVHTLCTTEANLRRWQDLQDRLRQHGERLPHHSVDPQRQGGTIAGNARRQLEHKSGRKVVTRRNYLQGKPKPSLPDRQ